MVAMFAGHSERLEQDRTVITRRGVVRGIAALAAAPLVQPMMMVTAQAQGAPLLTARTLNHIHIDASDVAKSADFYAVLFGARVRDKAKGFWVMLLPGDTSGFPHWLAINNTPEPRPNRDGGVDKPGQYTHMGIGVDFADTEATARLSEVMNERYAFAKAKPSGGWTVKNDFPGSRSIYFKDPDGMIIQLLRATDDAYTGDGVRDDAAPQWTPPSEKPLVQARSFNSMHFYVSDLDRAAAFYKDLLGTSVHSKSTDGSSYTLLLPNSTPGRATWLDVRKAKGDTKPGQYAYMGVGIEIGDGANSMENLAVAINKRFPFANAKAMGSRVGRPGARVISMQDPDGLKFELTRLDDDGRPANNA